MKEHYGFCIPGAKYYDLDEELHQFGRPAVRTMTPKEAVVRKWCSYKQM